MLLKCLENDVLISLSEPDRQAPVPCVDDIGFIGLIKANGDGSATFTSKGTVFVEHLPCGGQQLQKLSAGSACIMRPQDVLFAYVGGSMVEYELQAEPNDVSLSESSTWIPAS
jgi:hypothetical protein